ncbi:Imm32 family immunity protein [Kribbella sp.]|uniref:Imm32 family immunity protein n=1 Tax=Kribbella sp. TaxID=1871183 RepID=UPI003BB998F0
MSANAAGLISLARHLLTLADPTAPAGSHLHLTADQELTSTFDLILERLDDSGGRNE